LAVEEDAKDERFFEQDVETGEEDETTAYSCRAKLYNYFTLPDGKKEWRERGLGVLRLNVKSGDDGDEGSKPKARFLMRADGSHRVVLNTPVKKEIKFGTPSGAPPTNGFMYFLGTFDGRDNLEMLQIKVSQYSTRDISTSKLTIEPSFVNSLHWNSTRRSSICRRRCRIPALHYENTDQHEVALGIATGESFYTHCTNVLLLVALGTRTLGIVEMQA
jgi:hypothetical protein